MITDADTGPKAPPGNPRFPLTDSVRAIAILGVIACHVSPAAILLRWWGPAAFNAGAAGVDVFFMLSGFLLYRPYLAARADGRPLPSASRFLRRRALRILPGYWVALTLLSIWPGLPGVFTGDWWRYYGLLQIYPIGGTGAGLAVAWTLCVEATFYLLLPVYAAAMASVADPRGARRWMWREAAALVLLGAISYMSRYAVYHDGLAGWSAGALPGRFDFFAIGMALALASVAVERSPARRGWVGLIDRFPGACVALSGLAFAAMVHFAPQSHPNVPVLHLVSTPVGFGQEEANYWLCAIAAALLMLPVVFGDQRRGLTRRLLAARPLAGLGVISYGVYLYHDPLLGWFAPKIGSRPSLWLAGSPSTTLFVLTLVVSVPLAVLSYRLVELPFLRRRYRRPGGTDSAARAASRLRSVRIRRRARIAEEPAEV